MTPDNLFDTPLPLIECEEVLRVCGRTNGDEITVSASKVCLLASWRWFPAIEVLKSSRKVVEGGAVGGRILVSRTAQGCSPVSGSSPRLLWRLKSRHSVSSCSQNTDWSAAMLETYVLISSSTPPIQVVACPTVVPCAGQATTERIVNLGKRIIFNAGGRLLQPRSRQSVRILP